MSNKAWVVLFLGLFACNVDVGECYVRGDEGGGERGVGGGGTSSGVGGFGDAPLKPQNSTDYWDPCSSQIVECTVTWKAGSDVCKSQGTSGTCTTAYQGAHSSLDEAKERCEKAYGVSIGSEVQSCDACAWVTSASPNEKCKKVCDKIYNKCMDNCKDGKCRDACFKDYVACLRECDR